MFSLFAVLIYLIAFGLPIYFLIHFHAQAWYWHVLSAPAALYLGLAPMRWGFCSCSWLCGASGV